MAKYQHAIDRDIKALEEKHQSLKGAISEEKYVEIGEKIEEIRRLGIDLPDDFDDAKVQEIINQIVGLQFDEFSPQFIEESTKEIKKVAFLRRLEHIRLAFEEGKDVKEVLSTAKKYWDSIEKYYDGIDIREVRDKFDEIGLEITLSSMKQLKKVDMSKVTEKQNGLLIRGKLLSLLESSEVSNKDKLLIQAWLGESVDIKTGEIDEKAMERLVRIPKLWGVLAGVAEENQKPIRIANQEETEEVLMEESAERKQEITEICKKYGVEESKVRALLEDGKNVWIVKERKVYRVIAEPPIKKKLFSRRIDVDKISAIIYNNAQREVDGLREHYGCTHYYRALKDVVLSDNVERITRYAFPGTVEKVRFPSTLRCIEDCAFSFSKLTEVELPNSLEELQECVFKNSNALRNVKLGKGLRIIGNSAFMACALENIEIPSNVEKVGKEAFACNPLKSVIIQDGVKVIESFAFEDTKLDSIILPKDTEVSHDFVDKYVYVSRQDNRVAFKKEEEKAHEIDAISDLDELKKQKQELEALLARMNERLRAMEQAKENDLQK